MISCKKYYTVDCRYIVSRFRISRVTAYLEMKIWSLFSHGNQTIGNKILRKGGAISLSFHNIFNISPTSGVKLHIHLFELLFLISANLICRGTDREVF